MGYRRGMNVESPVLGGRYRLEGLIGRGGMASVWRATDLPLDRLVAIKRLHARMHDDPELAERFRREGRAVARLQHPNLVRLLDQGQEGDEPFLVFELVEGSDLKTIISQDGRLPYRDAAAICAQVARALAAAHQAGVVHRDIKSHNVLVTPDRVAKLTDFGIARIVETEGSNLTRTGIVMGSSDYLAPEQAEGHGVDERSDIYSLGVVLFEALTGRLPFTGDSPVAVATKHVYETPPDPRKLAPATPRQLSQVCLRALAKRPVERFASAAAFADALEGRATSAAPAGLDGHTTGRLEAVTRPPARQRRRRLAAAGGVAAAAAAVLTWQLGTFGGDETAAGDAGQRLTFAEVQDYDPNSLDADKSENTEEVGFVTDGKPSTTWGTESYKQADVAGKGGVGLRLQLAAPAVVREVRITSPTAGAKVRILGPGDSVDERPVLREGSLVAGTVVLPIGDAPATQEIVVWITELAQTRDLPNPYGAEIGEVEVRGVANT